MTSATHASFGEHPAAFVLGMPGSRRDDKRRSRGRKCRSREPTPVLAYLQFRGSSTPYGPTRLRRLQPVGRVLHS